MRPLSLWALSFYENSLGRSSSCIIYLLRRLGWQSRGFRPASVTPGAEQTIEGGEKTGAENRCFAGRPNKIAGGHKLCRCLGGHTTCSGVRLFADELKVLLNDERELTAKVIGTDPKTDVAVIKIDAENLPAATLADSAKLRVGDVVFAIGNPLGVGQTVTMGIVSATSRRVGILEEVAGYEDFIQTDAAINQGNSGGALIDARGRLVGINSAIISTSSGNIGIGFSIPINLANSIMSSLLETGAVSRGYLGVQTQALTADEAEGFGLPKDTKGVVVTDLNPADGPAAKAGLKREDIITAINDKLVTTRDDLRLIIAQTLPGTKIIVKYIRGGKAETQEVTLGKLPDDGLANGEFLPGIAVAALDAEVRKELRIDERVDGLVVTEVAENSAYSQIFPRGAVIVQLNRVPVTDLASAKRELRDGRNLAFVYYRGAFRYITFVVR